MLKGSHSGRSFRKVVLIDLAFLSNICYVVTAIDDVKTNHAKQEFNKC